MWNSLCDCGLRECGVMDVEEGGTVIGGGIGLVACDMKRGYRLTGTELSEPQLVRLLCSQAAFWPGETGSL